VTTAVGGYTDTVTVTVRNPVTGVTLNTTSSTLVKGATLNLNETVSPSTATNKSVTWSSSNTAVASVDGGGLVTAVGKGSATITVRTVEGGFTATCQITVNVPVTGVTLDTTTIILDPGATYQLNATIAPSDASNASVSWSWIPSNGSVATVSPTGLVTVKSTATRRGSTCTVTVKSADGGYTASCTITVRVPVTGVTLNASTVTVDPGDTYTLIDTVKPTNASNQNVTWTSSNPSIATVDGNGLVTGIALGTAVISVRTVDGGFTATCTITVPVFATGISGSTGTPYNMFVVTFNESISSASFSPALNKSSIAISGNTITCTRTGGSTFGNNQNYFVLVTGVDGTSRTITVKRNGATWTVSN